MRTVKVPLPVEVPAFVAQLAAIVPPPQSIWLIGSRANGRAKPDSDTDLMVFASHEFVASATKSIAPRSDTDVLVVYDGDRFKDIWSEKTGSLTSWQWTPVSEVEATYTGGEFVPDADVDEEIREEMKRSPNQAIGEFVEYAERAIRLWPSHGAQPSVAANAPASGARPHTVTGAAQTGSRMTGARTSYIVDRYALPTQYPTHAHSAEFWESLGRAVGTFGFLEEVLSKAIFSFTATRPYDAAEISRAFEEWLPKLERSLMDPLGSLIDSYGKAVREHPHATITNLDSLLGDLRKAAQIRNVLCHGSWRLPDSSGRSVPFFVNRKKERFETPIDKRFLDQTHVHCVDLICAVINTVTHMGWQFPGSGGPGEAIWAKKR